MIAEGFDGLTDFAGRPNIFVGEQSVLLKNGDRQDGLVPMNSRVLVVEVVPELLDSYASLFNWAL